MLEYQSYEETPLILLLRPHSNLTQTILNEIFTVEPNVQVTSYIDFYGNFCQRLITPIGKFAIDTHSVVETNEYVDIDSYANFTLIQDLPDDTIIYLLPSRFCESDKLNNKAFEIIGDISGGYQMAEAIRL